MMAILKREEGHRAISEKLENSARCLTSALAVVETVMSLGRQKGIPAHQALADVTALIGSADISVEVVNATTGELAIAAHAQYGKGSGHPARLNLGDCFACAMAKQHRIPLLYKGDDFARTDLA